MKDIAYMASPAINWRRSTYSGSQSNCVQIRRAATQHVLVRDSKDPNGPILTFTQDEWATFLLAQRRRLG